MRRAWENVQSLILLIPHSLRGLSLRLRIVCQSLGATPVNRWRLVVVAGSLLVCSYAVGVLAYVLNSPDIGVHCAFTPVVNSFDRRFLDPENQEPLQEGDTIVRLGNQPVANWPQLLRHLIDLRDRGETPELAGGGREGSAPTEEGTYLLPGARRVVRVEYLRPGETDTRSAWCLLGRSPLEVLLPSILWFFLKIGLFVVGVLVFWQRPGDRSAAQFFLLCSVSLGAYMGGYHWSRIVTQPALLLVFMVCALMLPAVGLHFYLLFPRPKRFLDRHPRWTLGGIYGAPLLFLLLLLSGYLRVRWLTHPAGGSDALASGSVRLVLGEMLSEIYAYFGIAALWYLAGVASLVHSYVTAADGTERNQVKWILFGAVVAVLPIGYSLYLAFWDPSRFGRGDATWPMFAASACVTVAFTVSITRYRLMQLDQILSSGFVYFLISSLAGLVYYGLVLAAMLPAGSRVGEGPSLGQALWVSGAALVWLVLLDLVRNRFKAALDRRFRRDKLHLDRTLKRMSQAVEQLVDPAALARRLLHTAADLLGVGRGAVYLRRGEPPLLVLADALGTPPSLNELSQGCPLVEALREQPVLSDGPRVAPVDPARRQLAHLGGEVARALPHEGELLGLLVLGPKRNDSYTAEDYNLLTALAQVTVLGLVSAEGRRTIETLNQELQAKVVKIGEQQRRILALQSQLLSRGSRAEARGESPDKPAEEPAQAPAARAGNAPAAGLVGSGPQVQQLLHLVRKVAASQSAVLFRGESGTGKELLALALHEHSPRAGGPFVKVHCAALAPGLLESELFGHVKGSFTTSVRDRVGRFEAAHGGTLFLDEIGDITLEVQTKLLRVLQEKTFERVGSNEPVRVDVRVLAATHRDLEGLIRQGLFREDLYYRLNVIGIHVPPLRDRIEDVPELALHFLQSASRRAGKEVLAIEDDALALLKGYDWPGNVRQLENVIERAVVLAEGPVVTTRDLPEEWLSGAAGAAAGGGRWPTEPDLGPDPTDNPGSVVLAQRAEHERRERERLVRALATAGGNKAKAARALGMARSTLVSRMRKLGLG